MSWSDVAAAATTWANQSVLYLLGGYVVHGYVEELGTSSVSWTELSDASTTWTDV